jgi:hypothetical protein
MHRQSVSRPVRIALVAALATALTFSSVASAQQPSEGSEPEARPASEVVTFDSAHSSGRAPDENAPTGGSGPRATNLTFSYAMVSGATLRGRSSTTTFAYNAQGCTYLTAGVSTGLILNTELNIPDGSIIKYLRVIYNDTSATGYVRGFLTRYTPGQATNDLVSAASTAAFAGGDGFVVSAEITETVNNANYAYTLIGWPSDPSSALQICGLRIAYYAPTGSTAYIPSVQR